MIKGTDKVVKGKGEASQPSLVFDRSTSFVHSFIYCTAKILSLACVVDLISLDVLLETPKVCPRLFRRTMLWKSVCLISSFSRFGFGLEILLCFALLSEISYSIQWRNADE
jgi:hypothetical protein